MADVSMLQMAHGGSVTHETLNRDDDETCVDQTDLLVASHSDLLRVP